ncbi:hypothetical protein MMC10_000309 [Thelotrema lepadinum]|nr:hypothetical protein [Thelotrema lepadinum]
MQSTDECQVAALPPKKANQTGTVTPEKAIRSAMTTATNSEKRAPISSPSANVPVEQDLNASLARLDVKNQPEPQNDLPDHGPLEALRQNAKLDDEKTHLSISSTKAPSLSGKSIASITTFAMDEKESIRPDDSASVQAAEDEDSNSGPGSGAQNSRFGSEAGAKAFHSQLQEISLQRSIPLPRKAISSSIPELPTNGIQAPLLVDADPHDPNPQTMALGTQIPFCMPDEKLLDAVYGVKDRMFVLQLEQEFVSFIQDSQAPSLDLPPYNSFFRMLAHKLGDYYRLSHFVDSSTNAVRLYKTSETQYAQLPTPLSAFNRKPSSEEAPIVPPSMKIMRRAGGVTADGQFYDSGGNTNVNSMVPSKAGSEVGSDSQKVSGVTSPTGSSTAKDKATKTREEKEAKYKEARDRIFADWKEAENGEANPSNEASAQVSRASSVNGRKKKKAQKNDDDGFQARSAYNVFYPNRQAPGYETTVNPMGYYNSYMSQNVPQGFQPGFGQNFGVGQQYQPMPQSQFFPGQMLPQNPLVANVGMLAPAGAPQQFMNYTMVQQPMASQFYPQMHQPQNHMPYQPPMQTPQTQYNVQVPRPNSQMSDQGWGMGGMQSPYQVYPIPSNSYQPQTPQPVQQVPVSNASNLTPPYAYGQLPQQAQSPGHRIAHPVPGSYNRSSFNAQSRVFVPGESGFASPATDKNGQYNDFRGQGQFPAQGNPGFNQPMPAMPQNQFVPSLGGSNSGSPHKVSNQTSQSQSPLPSTISKWGTPATLPPKPPPPANQHVPNSMPTFQNGTYSKPAGASQDTKAH